MRAADTDRMEAVPEAAGLEAIMTGIGIVANDDYEAIEKAISVYDVLCTNCKLKLVRDKHKDEIEKMDRKQRREFLKKKLMD